MDTLLFLVGVIGIVLIALAGSALFLFHDWRKRSIARMTEERALMAHRERIIFEREQKEKRELAVAAKKARIRRRALRKQAQTEAQNVEAQKKANTVPEAGTENSQPASGESKLPLRVV